MRMRLAADSLIAKDAESGKRVTIGSSNWLVGEWRNGW